MLRAVYSTTIAGARTGNCPALQRRREDQSEGHLLSAPGRPAPARLRQNRLEDWEIDPELQAFAATLPQDLFGE